MNGISITSCSISTISLDEQAQLRKTASSTLLQLFKGTSKAQRLYEIFAKCVKYNLDCGENLKTLSEDIQDPYFHCLALIKLTKLNPSADLRKEILKKIDHLSAYDRDICCTKLALSILDSDLEQALKISKDSCSRMDVYRAAAKVQAHVAIQQALITAEQMKESAGWFYTTTLCEIAKIDKNNKEIMHKAFQSIFNLKNDGERKQLIFYLGKQQTQPAFIKMAKQLLKAEYYQAKSQQLVEDEPNPHFKIERDQFYSQSAQLYARLDHPGKVIKKIEKIKDLNIKIETIIEVAKVSDISEWIGRVVLALVNSLNKTGQEKKLSGVIDSCMKSLMEIFKLRPTVEVFNIIIDKINSKDYPQVDKDRYLQELAQVTASHSCQDLALATADKIRDDYIKSCTILEIVK